MWYLIIPPIIVVLSLSFLLWYLSRKGADPAIAEKVTLAERRAQDKVAFSRTRGFFLRLLEKTTHRFKVSSLRMHNTMSELSQRIKARKESIQSNGTASPSEERKEEKGESPALPSQEETASIPVKPKSRFGFLRRFKKEMSQDASESSSDVPFNQERQEPNVPREREEYRKTYSPDVLLDQPIVRRSHREPEAATERESVARPMVSETATQPEKERSLKRKRTRTSVTREEELISRIAMNPKDFTSYEALGDYYLEMENIKDAKECYRQVLKLSPVHRMVKIKIRRLEKLLTREGE